MAKSNYLFGLLSLVTVFICSHFGSDYLVVTRGLSNDNRQSVSNRSLRQQAVKRIYDSEVGVREQGINAGKEVERYLSYVDLSRGQPWCAAFICWIYGQAGVDHHRSGWTPELFPSSKIIWSKAQAYPAGQISGKRQADSDQIIPDTGDIFALFFPEKNRIAHAGFVDQWKDPWLITVEGNTNSSGSREGDGVYRKRRLVKSVYKVARYIE